MRRPPRLLPRRPLTLRARLVALVLVLLTAVTLVVGVVTVLALQRSLVGAVDNQLTSAAGRSGSNAQRLDGDRRRPQLPDADDADPDRDRDHDGPGFLGAPGTSVGTLGAIVQNGTVVTAATVGTAGEAEPVSAAAARQIARLPVAAEPRSYHLAALGDYRVVADRLPDGRVLVTGLPMRTAEQTVTGVALVVAGAGAVLLLVAGIGGGVVVRRTLRPLQQVAATAAQVARTPLARGQVSLDVRVPEADPRTEVGQVSSAVNAMIGHVERSLAVREASEQRVRGFVADASHELRTPLAAIRGYAELTRRSGEEVPEGVARALSRVESEAARMTVLVEDLLLLARLDSGRPVESAPVDLTSVLVDALTDAQVAGPAHRWSLSLPDEPVVVEGDDQRLHQVVANLLANARTHTPPGTAVTADVGVVDGAARLRVVDEGPGIPADVLPTVFERFVRGESSRSRTHGSTGLGLAIVASIVAAHGGSVDVESEPGRTAFEVRLPLAGAARPPAAALAAAAQATGTTS
jgi:two-component system OmpR family sensor kinase